MKVRHLRAVPSGHKPMERQRYDRTLSLISNGIEEIHELNAAKRTIKKHLARARACGATERATYLDVALDALEEGIRSK